MLRLTAIIGILLLVTGVAGASPLADLCPFCCPDDPEQMVVTSSSISLQGICSGSTHIQSMSSHQSESSVSSANFGLSTSHGDTAILYTTNLSGLGPQSTIGNLKLLEFSGLGGTVEDSFYASRVNQTDLACEQVTGGTSATFTSGSFGSQLRTTLHPGIGIDLQYEFAAGSSSIQPNQYQGMAGSIHTGYATLQQYGSVQSVPTYHYDSAGHLIGESVTETLVQDTEIRNTLESRFTGVSAVSGSYHFSTVNG